MAVKKYSISILIYVLVVLLCDLMLLCSGKTESNDSKPCNLSKFIKGVCTVVTDCELAMESLKKGKMHRLKRCGFTEGPDPDEIVCCPTTSIKVREPEETTEIQPDTRASTKRRSQQYCEQISKDSMKNVIFHIIGGEDAKEGEFPHMAALGFDTDEGLDWACGATIINKNYLLTAAHCFTKQIKPKKVKVGVTNLDDPDAQNFNIKNITVHEEYSPSTKHNDIALVELDGDVVFNKKAYPACLYGEDDDPLGLIITGWGKTSINQEDDRSTTLQRAFVKAVDLKECNSTYAKRSMGTKTIDHRQLCAGTPPESPVQTDACWGDSGGPCQIKNKMGTYSIVSIISYGQQCGSRVPGVYTRVSAYLDWIEKYVWG